VKGAQQLGWHEIKTAAAALQQLICYFVFYIRRNKSCILKRNIPISPTSRYFLGKPVVIVNKRMQIRVFKKINANVTSSD
jgi:hypothetical protein